MDVKSAYLLAKGFNGYTYVQPLREEDDGKTIWKLSVRAYCLTESGHLWYLTSCEALTKGYHTKLGEEKLIIVVQMGDICMPRRPISLPALNIFFKRNLTLAL